MRKQVDTIDRRLSVAPMMDWTDRFDRYFLRLLSRRTLLYTEMITAMAIRHGDVERLLAFDPAEHPVACQIGGAEPEDISIAARHVAARGYDEINLNIGCPSDRVQSGRFGACLMAEPDLVHDLVAAARESADIPVTVKSRIGIDGRESYDDLAHFIDRVRAAGCRTFVIHARIAILRGLSPKENREIPPLKYPYVHRIKQDFPDLEIIINGGIRTLEDAREHCRRVDGAMIGRAAYQTPYMLSDADRVVFGDQAATRPDRHDVIASYLPYIERERAKGVPLHHMTRHILGLFNGRPGARTWRRFLSENAYRANAGPDTVRQALTFVPRTEDTAATHATAG